MVLYSLLNPDTKVKVTLLCPLKLVCEQHPNSALTTSKRIVSHLLTHGLQWSSLTFACERPIALRSGGRVCGFVAESLPHMHQHFSLDHSYPKSQRTGVWTLRKAGRIMELDTGESQGPGNDLVEMTLGTANGEEAMASATGSLDLGFGVL